MSTELKKRLKVNKDNETYTLDVEYRESGDLRSDHEGGKRYEVTVYNINSSGDVSDEYRTSRYISDSVKNKYKMSFIEVAGAYLRHVKHMKMEKESISCFNEWDGDVSLKSKDISLKLKNISLNLED